MARFEKYKPLLKSGRLIPQGEKLIYETDAPVDQIVLPIEMVDFLLMCNGDYSIEEIIELLYHRKGSIQFKSIHKTVYYLNARGFLENGDQLDSENSRDRFNEIPFLHFQPVFQLSVGKRIFNEGDHPRVFYFFAMFLILTSIFGLRYASTDWFNLDFLKINGSYLQGLIFISITTSVLLSLKNVYKCLMLIFLTGRAYNFNLVFNGLSLYFYVRSDSLFLVSNKFLLTLFHLTVSICYFPMVSLMYFLVPDFPYFNEAMSLSFMLLLFDLNPFQESEISYFLKTIFNDDTINKISKYLNQRSLLSLINPSERSKDQSLYYIFTYFALIWSFVLVAVFYMAVKFNGSDVLVTLKKAEWKERIVALFMISFMISMSYMLVYNSVKLYFVSVFRPLVQRTIGKIRKRKFKKVEHFRREDILKALENLPLLSYFNQDLLYAIIDRSEVKSYAKDTPVILQGEEGRHLFVLLSGSLEIRKGSGGNRNAAFAELFPPSIFGEIAVIEEVRRAADVVATKSSVVLEVPAQMLKDLATQSQYIRELDSFQNAIMVSQFFSSAPVFRDVSETAIHLFTSKGKIESYEKDGVIFKQGDPGDGFYLLLRGSVGVSVNGRPIARIQQGGFFGEISMIADVPRTATIFAMGHTQVLKIGRDAFWEILSHDIEMAMFIESVGEMRIREDIEVIKSNSVKVA